MKKIFYLFATMFVLNCTLLTITIILHFILTFDKIISVFSNLLTISFLVYLVYLSYIYRSVFLQNIFLKNKCLNVTFGISLVICFLSGVSLFLFQQCARAGISIHNHERYPIPFVFIFKCNWSFWICLPHLHHHEKEDWIIR